MVYIEIFTSTTPATLMPIGFIEIRDRYGVSPLVVLSGTLPHLLHPLRGLYSLLGLLEFIEHYPNICQLTAHVPKQ